MTGLVLAIDATSPLASAALAEAGGLLSQVATPARGGRSLIDLIDESFRAAKRRPADLAMVVAVSGPGSFTGVRITLATAMGLTSEATVSGDGAGPALCAVSSLAALALQAPAEAGTILSLVDAMRGERFAQRFGRGAGGVIELGDPFREPASGLRFDGVDVVIGFPASLPGIAPGAPPAVEASPLAAGVAAALSSGAARGLLRSDVDPLYLRAPAVTIATRRAV